MAARVRRRWKRPSARRWVQLGFLALIVVGVFVVRGNAERWCPFGGVEAIHNYLTEGNVLCSVAVSNFFILGALLVSVLLLRRAFCSHVCPIGTLSEWLRMGAAKLGIKPVRVSARADRVLSLLKYLVLVVIVYFTWVASELLFRAYCPAYAMLGRHGEDITFWAYVVSGAIVVASLFISLPFCRWLCPLAAVMNPLSKLGLTRVARDTGACVDCGKCARACPMGIPVNEVEEVTEARCTLCLQCVDSCPTRGRRTLAWRLPGPARRALPQGLLVVALLGILGTAVLADRLWPLPSYNWTRGEVPVQTATVELEVENLACRGRASLFVGFLERDDEIGIDGYLKLEAWPDPEGGRARITYDPTRTDADTIKAALTEAYYDYQEERFWISPFGIEGYDPLGLGLDASED